MLGYVYVMERMALRNTAASIEALERLLPPGVRATRCMRVHSSVGRDATHVAESVEVIATLPPEDRGTIARAAFETSSLMHKEASDYPGDQAMRGILKEIGGAEALLWRIMAGRSRARAGGGKMEQGLQDARMGRIIARTWANDAVQKKLLPIRPRC